MADPYFIQTLTLSGFRAYLQPQTFNFNQKRCLAIFAPNGTGKSSVIDALEFMFSKDGTLERLGLRAVNNQAGLQALVHNLADDLKIASEVTIEVASGRNTAYGSRSATETGRPIPPVATSLKKCFKVSPIIRGYELRSFVEHLTPEERYTEIAAWLQLDPLTQVQTNIRSLRKQVTAAAADEKQLQNIDQRLARATSQVIRTWDVSALLSHVNNAILAPLDQSLQLTDINEKDAAYIELEFRAKVEENKLGLGSLRQMRNSLVSLQSGVVEGDINATGMSGAIPVFERAVEALSTAKYHEAKERTKVADAVFQDLWNAAAPFFEVGVQAPETCPVCETLISQTTAGNAVAIRQNLKQHLDHLADYAVAKKSLDEAQATATKAHDTLLARLPTLIDILDEENLDLKEKLIAYQSGINSWPQAVPPASTNVVSAMVKLLQILDWKITEIEQKQGDHTYIKAKANIDQLLELQTERTLALRTQEELRMLSSALKAQEVIVSAQIRARVQTLLDKVQTPMNDMYKIIQGCDAASIRLALPAEEDTNQQRLNLLIDFSQNRMGVHPSGYLSDSQIHSIALALRIAAITTFNAAAPIIALDDVVTSYDADHRRTIARLISTISGDCQILITTHDERFFNYLKELLLPQSWHFKRITSLDRSFGPHFADHKVSDEIIEARWSDGHSAANEMRRAEEEWLQEICRSFGASVRIRPIDTPYNYDRGELAMALAKVLNKAGLLPPLVPGVNNSFTTSLQQGVIENFGSHFQAGPYGDGSIGDEKTRWQEFKSFRDLFACKKCLRKKFRRPFGFNKPVCSHEACEAQFEFAPA
jgi:ABC-type lipoprotein export system ATPase subunit